MSNENKPTFDLAAAMAAHVASFNQEPPGAAREKNILAPFRAMEGVFNATSLNSWAKIASDAGVPSIPVATALEIPVDVIMRFDCPEEGDAPYHRQFRDLLGNVPDGQMLRWDCCASLNLKWAMDDGELDHRAKTALEFDDPRFFDILYEYPGESISILQRPWVEARRVDSHPVEYRVFVQDSQILGISSYYPQRPLTLDDDVRREVEESLALSQKIVAAATAAGTVPWMGRFERAGMDPRKVSCSLDFLVTEQGEVQFIEAGPPFGVGAHPCCFEKNRAADGSISVSGVALALNSAVLPLDEFFAPAARQPAP
jgi:hypothetical protein